MCEDFINEIYEYSDIITKLTDISNLCKSQRGIDLTEKWNNLIPDIILMYKNALSDKLPFTSELAQAINEASSFYDLGVSAFADFLDDRLIPALYSTVAPLCKIDVTEKKYRIFSSKSGYLSLQSTDDKRLIHSAINPMSEAYHLAESLYNCSYQEYHILGAGLGYLAKALYELSEHSMDIYVYELLEEISSYADSFGVLYQINPQKLHVITRTDEIELLKAFADSSEKNASLTFDSIGYYVAPYENEIFSQTGKEILKDFLLLQTTHQHFGRLSEINFYRNLSNSHSEITEIDFNAYPNDWAIIAAGPSLDSSIDYLRKNRNKYTLVAVSTVLKKLQFAGIVPDFVTVLDPQNRTFGHFEGLLNHNVPLIFASSANWQFSEYYKGRKYLIPVQSIAISDAFYESKGQTPWTAYHTVTSFALDFAIHYCKSDIHLFGVDLSYSGDSSHAIGTMDEKKISTDGMIPIIANDGNQVFTTVQFQMYISEMEKQISMYPERKFINHSAKGAIIKGSEFQTVN